MSIRKIQLRKLLRLFYARPNLQTSLLRADIRNEIKKRDGDADSNGGDFHVPFWADAKEHVAGRLDLRAKARGRVTRLKGRSRLYPELANGFLSIWEEKIRWRNERFEFHPRTAKGQLQIEELSAVIKVENVLSVRIWDGTDRAVYPYFSEDPSLPIEGVRLGFWALNEALEFRAEDLRILDILRGAYFRLSDAPLKGNERALFVERYKAILDEWEKLRKEYP